MENNPVSTLQGDDLEIQNNKILARQQQKQQKRQAVANAMSKVQVFIPMAGVGSPLSAIRAKNGK